MLRSESGLDFHSTNVGLRHVPSPRQDRLPVFRIQFLESAIQLLKAGRSGGSKGTPHFSAKSFLEALLNPMEVIARCVAGK